MVSQMVYFYFGEDQFGLKVFFFCQLKIKLKLEEFMMWSFVKVVGKKIFVFFLKQYVNDVLQFCLCRYWGCLEGFFVVYYCCGV